MAYMIFDKPLGVQSYSFRKFTDAEKLCERIAAAGLCATEVCGVHVDAENEESIAKYIAATEKAGVKTTSFGINWLGCEEDKARALFELAKRLGIKVMGASFPESHIAMVEKLCDEYGIKVAIHNHGRDDIYGTTEKLSALFAKCSSNVGFCLDACWALDAGERPEEMAKTFYDRLYGVHFKDMVFDSENKCEEVILGTGLLNLPALKQAIEGAPIEYFSIEYELNEDEPTEDIKVCIDNVMKYFA